MQFGSLRVLAYQLLKWLKSYLMTEKIDSYYFLFERIVYISISVLKSHKKGTADILPVLLRAICYPICLHVAGLVSL